ncbi:MAG: FAD-dependent thymidylate synthase [Candidatus Omnitrophica bacterium]|nr:FAD-dependent thymidylate synthase [Candidatus Omnitrophota bacterium]
MAQTKLNVKLLEMTQNAVTLIYAACRQCYSAKFAGDIFEETKEDQKKQEEFISKVAASGHESPLEHVKFTFAIEGVSRALTHQLVRHRVASYSQQSQRYVKATDFNYIIPPSIEEDKVLKEKFIKVMEGIQENYDQMLELFKKKGKSGEQANQDARFILPQAAETKIVVTMNCRELLHFFEQRCCARAQWEIRALACEMLKVCQVNLPAVFQAAGAKCEKLSYCPESKQFSCGKYPVKEEVIK